MIGRLRAVGCLLPRYLGAARIRGRVPRPTKTPSAGMMETLQHQWPAATGPDKAGHVQFGLLVLSQLYVLRSTGATAGAPPIPRPPLPNAG
jgi:hypothetical protein